MQQELAAEVVVVAVVAVVAAAVVMVPQVHAGWPYSQVARHLAALLHLAALICSQVYLIDHPHARQLQHLRLVVAQSPQERLMAVKLVMLQVLCCCSQRCCWALVVTAAALLALSAVLLQGCLVEVLRMSSSCQAWLMVLL
jgi:hypothetical protein